MNNTPLAGWPSHLVEPNVVAPDLVACRAEVRLLPLDDVETIARWEPFHSTFRS
jgi:hypothetical protein